MARIKGVTTFAGNFESEKAAPLVDMYCETQADMIDDAQQRAYDGNKYMYYGRKAIVFNDPDTSKNGTYQLIEPSNPTLLSSWEKLAGDSSGREWIARSSAVDNLWYNVCYGNGMFVAVASSGTNNRAMYSYDGVNWNTAYTPVDANFYGVAYGKGLFVAVAYSGVNEQVMVSSDGINWSAVDLVSQIGVSVDWHDIAYGNGLFVAVAFSDSKDVIMTSPDGYNWTLVSLPNNRWLNGVTYGNGKFVVTGLHNIPTNTAYSLVSIDGINWTESVIDNSLTYFYDIVYGSGLFVTVAWNGGSNQIATSPDGINWTVRQSPASNQWLGVAYGEGIFVAVSWNGSGNRAMMSENGIDWFTLQTPVDNRWNAVCYGNGMFVAVADSGTGNRVMTSGESTISNAAHQYLYPDAKTLSNAELISYSALKAKADSSSLDIGKWYLIIDYNTMNKAGDGIIHTATVEQLYVQAITRSEVHQRAYSKDYFNEVILYDFKQDALKTQDSPEWDTGTQVGGDTTISNVTATTFDLDNELIIDSDFYMEVEDDSNSYSYTSSDQGTGFTITDLGGGNVRVTILDTIDLTDPAYNYIYIEGNFKIADMPGKIIYRENIERNIKAKFDFRGVMFNRKKIDTTSIPTWNNTTTYNFKDIVIHNNYIYMAMMENTNQTPLNGGTYWVLVSSNASSTYGFSRGRIINHNINYVNGSDKLFYALSVYDRSTETVSFNLDWFENIDFRTSDEDDVVLAPVYKKSIKDVIIKSGSNGINIFGSFNNTDIPIYSNDVYVDDGGGVYESKIISIRNTTIYGAIRQSRFSTIVSCAIQYIQNSNIGNMSSDVIYNITSCNIGVAFNNNGIYRLTSSTVGNTFRNSYVNSVGYSSFGNSIDHLIINTNIFSNNHIGDQIYYFRINNNFVNNKIGDLFGRNGTYFETHSTWSRNKFGSRVFNVGSSFIGGAISSSTFESSISYFNVQQGVIGSYIGNSCHHISTQAMSSTSFDGYNNNINYQASMTFTTFHRGVSSINSTSTAQLNNNEIYQGGFNLTTSSTHLFNNYQCIVYRRPDGTVRLRYYDDTDSLVVTAPDA